MKTAKEEVRELLDQLPEDASLEDIQYHLYVRQKVQKGLEAMREDKVILQEIEKRMARKVVLDPTSLGKPGDRSRLHLGKKRT